MAGKLYNLARMTTATTGTGTITLGSAVAPFLTFAQAGVSNGDVVSYSIIDGTANSEIGTGTYTSAGTTLTRTVTKSTNSNAAISLSGSAHVLLSPRAEDIVTGVTAGTGLTGNITAPSGTIAVSLSTLTNSLGSDVALNNASNYFDGPSVAQGTTGTWWASGSVTLEDTGVSAQFLCKLWDGTTVIASGAANTGAGTGKTVVALSGYLASPAGNIRISVKDTSATTGFIRFNSSGSSKDSTISVMRIA